MVQLPEGVHINATLPGAKAHVGWGDGAYYRCAGTVRAGHFL